MNSATGPNPSSPPPRRGASVPWLALIVTAMLGLLLTCYRLGAADVCTYNEAVEALFVQQMVEHGEVLFPRGFGREPMYKPPLFHWTALAIDRLSGIHKVTAGNVRLPSALYGVAGILLVVGFTANWLDSGFAGLLAGMVLLGSYQYLSEARYGRVDMTLTFCEALALFGFAWWWRRGAGRQRTAADGALRYLLALALGMGVLAKGPVGALLPLMAIGIFIALRRGWDAVRRLFSPGSVLVMVAVAGSWYIACLATGRLDFLSRQLGSENFGRFFGTLGYMPAWYYVVPLLFNSIPLSLLAIVAVISVVAGRRGTNEPEAQTNRTRDEIAQLLAIFYLVTVIFFTIAAYKRRAYLLPLWPANAALIAWWLTTRLPARWRRPAAQATLAVCALLALGFLFYLPRRELASCRHRSFRPAAEVIDRVVGPNEPLYIYGMDDPATLLFYLDRPARKLEGRLGDAPAGYVLLPAQTWARDRNHAPGLEPILDPVTSTGPPLILLRHGKAYARLKATKIRAAASLQ